MDIRNIIAKRAAQELKDGQVVSLGVGIPTLIANHVPPGVDVVILTPNGAIGVGPARRRFLRRSRQSECERRTHNPESRGSYFDSAKSYGVLRGGHTDMTFLGTFQVDSQGTIASYEVPGKMVAGMGGAMELLAGAKVVNVVTEHCSSRGENKLVSKCTFPLTGVGEVDVVVTERAVFRRYPDKGFVLEEVARGYTLDDIAESTRDGLPGVGERQDGRLRARTRGRGVAATLLDSGELLRRRVFESLFGEVHLALFGRPDYVRLHEHAQSIGFVVTGPEHLFAKTLRTQPKLLQRSCRGGAGRLVLAEYGYNHPYRSAREEARYEKHRGQQRRDQEQHKQYRSHISTHLLPAPYASPLHILTGAH